MRGHQERTGALFSYVSTEDRIPKAHPLWQMSTDIENCTTALHH